MIELYVLRQFAAFAEAGTLSEAAEVLHLSQPALSRNMKKLEEDLGVILFERKKNKLELNQNGFYVLDLTRTLLENADALAKKAQDFDRKNRTIRLGICAPALLWTVTPFISQVYPYLPLQTPYCDKVFGVYRLALYGICFGYGGGLLVTGLFGIITGREVTTSSIPGIVGAVIGYLIGAYATKRLQAKAEAEAAEAAAQSTESQAE